MQFFDNKHGIDSSLVNAHRVAHKKTQTLALNYKTFKLK